MASKPIIFVVGADKGGVGKTTVTRLLIPYLHARSVQTRIFDTESPLGDLKRFYQQATVVDINVVRDQMRVFDGISPEFATVLDIRAGVLSPTLRALDDSHFLDDVRAGEVILVVLHVLGPSMSSLNEVGAATKAIGDGLVRHLVVKNHINDTEFDAANDPRFAEVLRLMAPATINVANLAAVAAEKVDSLDSTFEAFCRPESGQSRTLRGYVRRWLDVVWSEFDRVGIPNILSA